MANAGDVIRMLDEAERAIPQVIAIGNGATAALGNAAAAVRVAGAGVSDLTLASNIDAQQRQLQAALNALAPIAPIIRRQIHEIQGGFGRRR